MRSLGHIFCVQHVIKTPFLVSLRCLSKAKPSIALPAPPPAEKMHAMLCSVHAACVCVPEYVASVGAIKNAFVEHNWLNVRMRWVCLSDRR